MWTLKAHTGTLQSIAQTNRWSPSRSSHKYVAALPIQTNGCMASALTIFVLPHDVQAGHNVCHRRSPCSRLIDLIVVQLVVKPRKNVLVVKSISHNKRLGFIDGHLTSRHLCWSHRHSGILLLGNAGTRQLGYVEASGKDKHHSILPWSGSI